MTESNKTSLESQSSENRQTTDELSEKLSVRAYPLKTLEALYALSRMYLSSGFYQEAEQLALGIISIKEQNSQSNPVSGNTAMAQSTLAHTSAGTAASVGAYHSRAISGEKHTPARLILATIHFEKGNYSLAANHYRIASQITRFSLLGRLGLLACYCALRDFNRAAMLALELDNSIEKGEITLTQEQQVFFQIYKSSISANSEK